MTACIELTIACIELTIVFTGQVQESPCANIYYLQVRRRLTPRSGTTTVRAHENCTGCVALLVCTEWPSGQQELSLDSLSIEGSLEGGVLGCSLDPSPADLTRPKAIDQVNRSLAGKCIVVHINQVSSP